MDAVSETPETILKCPNCSLEIRLTEALAAPLLERSRRQSAAEIGKLREELTMRSRSLDAERERNAKDREDIERARASMREAITSEVNERLKVEGQRIAAAEAARASETSALQLRALTDRVAELTRKLFEAQQAELQLRAAQARLEDEKRLLELTVARRLDEERTKIRDDAQREQSEAFRLKQAEWDQRSQALNRQIDDLKRKAEQGSQQAQGEALEIELEGLLRLRFAGDVIEPVAKGVFGGDVLQRVRGPSGADCGTILWESKRAKAWNDAWLVKLRDDQRAARAEFAAIVTTVLPKAMSTFDLVDGVWVTNMACALGLAAALRITLIEASATKQAALGRQDKIEVLYSYFSGAQFKQRVEAIVESFRTMREDLESEKAVLQRVWAKREKQIDRIMASTSGMHGDIAGIIGGAVQPIEMLELKSLLGDTSPDGPG
jgi:hypothetical protein